MMFVGFHKNIDNDNVFDVLKSSESANIDLYT